ncbi:GH92 family glycosyl hydrolase [Oerskovia enterophila]|uniref:GH92 family glycosyl hydrolase n=1 Tax=Oerskovia enterophila TaxID=43678 RepID=UPI00339B910D
MSWYPPTHERPTADAPSGSKPTSPGTPAGKGRRRIAGVLAAGLALPMLPLGVGTASAAPEPGDFSTSFETGDAAALDTTVAQRDGAPWQSNVTGPVSTLPGSALGKLAGVTASGENLPNEGAAKLADDNSGTKWLTRTTTGWVAYAFTEPVRITGYSMTSGDDAEGRDPKSWTLEGSTDGTTWVPLDQRTNEDFPQRKQARVFEVATPGTYQHYRLNVTANSGEPLLQLADWNLSTDLNAAPAQTPMVTKVGAGPSSGPTIKTNVGFTGTKALRYAGSQLADGPSSATNILYDDVDVAVGEDTRLSYTIFPELLNDLAYPSTYASVDVRFTDGTYLSELGARDQHDTPFSPEGQGTGKILYANQWNSIQVDLGGVATGKTVDEVLLGYDNPTGKAGTRFQGWVDDIAFTASPERIDGSSLTNYVDTRRGTFATGGFSRGNNIPASAVPNGFNFWTPMTDAASQSWLYAYQQQNNANNKPQLQGIGVSHEPSPWMGDRNQLAFLPAAGGGTPNATLGTRALEFTHDDETAQPDYYGVRFTNGIQAEVTPTDHGAVLRFSYATDQGQVLVDSVSGDAKLAYDAASGTLSGWVDGGSGLSAGRSRMFISGTFDRQPSAVGTAAGNRANARFATFDTSSDKTVELRVATSFISQAQARKNLDLEVTGRSFEDVRSAAQSAWNDRLKVIEVEGANEDKLTTLYSNLYRLNLYPNSQFENTGTAEAPKFQYASPVAAKTGSASDTTTNAKIVDGKIYVNNGFWDTYRTAWPAYSLLYPELAAELVDGFVQQYRDGGWVARWSSPGYADLMTGTSSDVAFADAYLKGVPLADPLATYDAALKNATVLPPNNAVGRKGLDTSQFLGYTQASTHESVSWGLEGLVNDFGIGNMAAALAEDPATPDERREQLREESEYFLERATHYVNLFDPATGFFQGRNADGTFEKSPETFNPEDWGGPYTETSGWNFAFHAPQDGQGLANLYGGQDGLEAKLDLFFSTPEKAPNGGIHERLEARDVRMGQWGMSNQVSHHIPYLYDAAGAPSKAQEKVRESLRRLFVGSDIGQGYPGDEDNGEMSSWWILSSLGIYPLQVGSEEYAIGSPQFTKATVHLESGDLVVDAPQNSVDNVYVQSLTVDGEAHTSTSIKHSDLVGGTTLEFEMGPEPSAWGTGEDDAPPSLTTGDEAPESDTDVTTSGLGTVTVSDGTPAAQLASLTDNTSQTRTTFTTGTPVVTWKAAGLQPTVTSYTLTSGATGTAAPKAWKVEGSNDGQTWTTLDERTDQQFRWAVQTRPFALAEPAAYSQYRVAVTATSGEGALALAELELLADPKASTGAELTLTAGQDVATTTGTEVKASLATLVGVTPEEVAAGDVSATVTFGDGSEPATGILTKVQLGGYTVTAPHTFAAPGVYPVTVTVTRGDKTVTASLDVSVELVREGSLLAAYDNVCIGDVGTTFGSCDGQGVFFDRAQLAAKGFVQGQRGTVPGTDLAFDVPAVPVAQPDNATGDGQTIEIDVPADAEQLSVIGTGTEKNQVASGTLTFDDGSSQPIDLSFGDWSGAARNPVYGNIAVAVTDHRLRGGSPQTGTPAAIFATAPITLPEGKRPVSLTLPDQPGSLSSDGRIHVFAVASDGTPVEHAPLVVEAAAGVSVAAGASLEAALATVTGGRATAGSPLRAAITWGDGSDVTPGTVVPGDVAGTVEGAHTYAQPGTYTAYVTVDDGYASKSTPVTVTVTEAAPALDVATTVKTQCTAKKVTLSVTAVNGESFPVTIKVVTPFGTKTFTNVGSGKSAHQSFATRAGSIEAGTATVTATATVDGEEVVVTSEVAYGAATCG